MNRATIIYVSLAVLLAHILAIHKTPGGRFSAPYDEAHVAYRQGRNLVHQGTTSWNPGETVCDSYPSLPWVGLSAVAERAYLGPNRVTQVAGVVAALMTLGVLAGFALSRLAGLIATGLFAASGTVAAAAGSGTEMTTLMLVATLTVLAYEHGWKRALALFASLLVWMRPEGIAIVACLLAFEALLRPERRHKRPIYASLIVGVFAWGLLSFVRWQVFGTPFSAYWRDFVHFNASRVDLGVAYVKSFLLGSGSALLLIIPTLMAMVGKLEARGVRAFLLFAAWAGLAAWSGGNSMPYWALLAPAIPMLALAVQVAVRTIMDSEERSAPFVAALLGLGVVSSLLVSKVPGNLGPIPLESLQDRWLTPNERLARDYPSQLGRRGLLTHAKATDRLRCLGIFLRDKTLGNTTVHTLWPGAIGYLSRRRVIDIIGRAWPSGQDDHTQSWAGSPKVDLVAALSDEPDYLVLFIDGFAEGARPVQFLRETLDRYDIVGGTPERILEILDVIQGYELVCVPVPHRSTEPGTPSPYPFPILRARKLGLTPSLRWVRDGERVRLEGLHNGHELVVDLQIVVEDQAGERRYLSPVGTSYAQRRQARSNLLLFESGDRAIDLFSFQPPPGARRLEATLLNPGSLEDSRLIELGEPAILDI